MDLDTRFDLSNSLQRRVRVALAAALTDIMLLTLASQGTDAQKKSLRVRQRWALQALSDMDRAVPRMALMVASKAPDAQVDDGLSDAELTALVNTGVGVLAGVELHVPDESLPAPA